MCSILAAVPILLFGICLSGSIMELSFSQSLMRVLLTLYPSLYAPLVLTVVFNDKKNKDTPLKTIWPMAKQRFFGRSKHIAIYCLLAGLGFLCLFFPGYWFVAQFCFVPTVMFAESCTLKESFSRTYTLTRECRVSLFVLFFFHFAIQALVLYGASWTSALLFLLPLQFTLFGLILTYAYIHIRLFHEGAIEQELFDSLSLSTSVDSPSQTKT